ncbi:MAG: AcrR family transcriptional regulator [Kiritimatiellia bacterium]|jgi:AcrR family transcriptional regulator
MVCERGLARKVNTVYLINMSDELSPRERRRRAMHERILDTALELVVNHGFDALTMGRLARELDYTPGAIYRYYDGKDQIIDALTARVVLSFGQVVVGVRDDLSGSSELVRIVAMLRSYRQLGVQAPHRFGLISLLMAEPRVILPDATASSSAFTSVMGALAPLIQSFEGASSAGELHPGLAMDRSLVAFSAVHGLMQLRKQERHMVGLVDLDRLCDETSRALLVGWGASRSQVEVALRTVNTLGDLLARSGGLT